MKPTPGQVEAAETDGQLLQRLGADASLWAAEFRKTAIKLGYSDMDEGWLIGWFANAIENAEVTRRAAAADVGEPIEQIGLIGKYSRPLINATIERCAHVALIHNQPQVAAAIRALKDKL